MRGVAKFAGGVERLSKLPSMAGAIGNFAKRAAADFLDYDTPKYVKIKSKKIGALCRVIQLLVIGYVIGYNLIYLKGYQMPDIGVSAITTKVKGIQYTDAVHGGSGSSVGSSGARTWDPADYVVPPQMTNSFFIMTNTVVTRRQSQGTCSEDVSVSGSRCSSDADCPPGKILSAGNGAFTGACLKTAQNVSGACQITSWCPLENDTVQGNATMSNARNFTVLIKNFVFFPYYNKYRTNIPENATKQYLQSCTFDPHTNPQCPIFRIGDIIDNINGERFDRLALLGGVVAIRIDWSCNFDYDVKHCVPQYSFARLDGDATASLVSQGYNFRFSYNYEESGSEKRTLVKAYGILFVVSCTASAGAFHLVPLLFSVGSGIGLLSISSIVCDFVVNYVDKKRHEIKKKKFDQLGGVPKNAASTSEPSLVEAESTSEPSLAQAAETPELSHEKAARTSIDSTNL